MKISTRDLQARVAALGFSPGPIDGLWGPRTQQAQRAAMAARKVGSVAELFHCSGLHRIHLHWTAGASGVIELERQHYHLLIGQDARAYAGALKPEANADCTDGVYAAHTRAMNTGAIGVALDAMAGALETPFHPGPYPVTPEQVALLADEVADLCLTYDIPVTPFSVLTHAEVQPTLGVWQRRKWDITWLPGMKAPGKPREVGDSLRARISSALEARAA
ncbi:N-acetylmuramoyl-L-alanine amidase [Salipiger sp. PrR002]|uniref:N-acetylmuramoyl-L-alanine amidase n=1 Tax=Salipiger sp. PrR002 TaxID=2706489 RepID=UPI0013BC72D7|nr:N-acetylmuramoyl-L-alanine amidase [Salipiger sp. PrR002]NDW00049.1 N-acetylmuramoyl-L-alanine amidase [Salipiger sp. PrR002]NDW56943.1 N-acetylmuramoyl-L-alanine amidase [Salipiger sp. PrR004]